MISAFILACSGDDIAPPVLSTLSDRPVPVLRYVAASSLNLRAAGSAAAPRLGVLSINSPVTVMSPGSSWSEIEVANGSTGWVDTAFLSSEPLTVERARQAAAAAESAEEVLSWRQRSAALSPLDLTLLGELAEAYEATGDEAHASIIRQQLSWPAAILPVERIGAGGEVWLLVDTGLLEEAPFADDRPTMEKASLLGYPNEKEWWVLPDVGAAVPARLARFEQGVLNECAGDFGVWAVLTLSEPLPPSDRALVATHGPLPASWSEPVAPPRLSRAEAKRRLEAFAAPRSSDAITTRLAPAGDTWVGVARWAMTADGDFFTTSAGIYARITAEGAVRLIREEPELDSLALVPYGQRDLDDDGSPETIWGGCEVDIFGDGGLLETATPNTCCGC